MGTCPIFSMLNNGESRSPCTDHATFVTGYFNACEKRCTVNCSCVGKLFSHSLQSLVPMCIRPTPIQSMRMGTRLCKVSCPYAYFVWECMRMGTRLCKEWENNFPTQLQFTVMHRPQKTEVHRKRGHAMVMLCV